MRNTQRLSSGGRAGRRIIVAAVALTSMFAFAGCGAGGTDAPTSAPTSAPAAPGELTVVVEGGGHGELQPIADKFTQETGTKVTFVELPYDGLYDRLTSELSSGNVTFDVCAVDAVWITALGPGLAPIDDLFTADVKADSFPALLAEATFDGNLIGMPAWTNAELLFYRSDLFNDPENQASFKQEFGYDLAAPATWQQYLDAAKFFTKGDMFGADVKGAVETEWLATVLQAGGKGVVLDQSGNVIVNDAAHKAALDFYVAPINMGIAPPGASQIDWGAAQNMFNQGQLAMTRFWAHAYTQIPSDAPVYGKVGVVPMPAGEAGFAGIPGAWYLSVPRAGGQQDLAKQFIAFAYENNAMGLDTPLGLAATKSALASMQDQPGHENLRPLIETLNAPATVGRPANAKWQEIVDTVLTPTLQKALTPGADTQKLLDDAKAQIEAIIK